MVKKIYTLFAAIFMVVSMFAAVPQKMSYQAVIRNSYNVLVTNKTVSVKISILQNQTPVYVELQSTTTNENGLISLEIGNGVVLSGTFASIDWGTGVYYIKSETDPDGGTYYSIVGTSELLSVPYALYSTASGNGVSIDDSNISSTKTWSSFKINSQFGTSGSGVSIDDSSISNAKTWSSFKINSELGAKVNSSALSTVATTGNFSDLKGKPTTLAGYGITDGGTIGNGTGTSVTMSGDATMNAAGVVKISSNAVTSAKIMDGSIEDEDLDKLNIPLSGFGAPAANISMNGYKLTNLGNPVSDKDAVNKIYVDNAIASGSGSSGSSTFVPIMSLDNNMNLSIKGGNLVSLADLYQSLSLAGTILSISGPRDSHVDLAGILAQASSGTGGVVTHDASLTGSGTSSSALGIANQGVTPLKMTGISTNGNAGQVLSSNGNGSFNWADAGSVGGSGLSLVAVIPNDGITATVSNVLPTSTITLGLGAISPSSINTTGSINGGDITGTTLNGSLNASNITGTLRTGLFGANTIPTTALTGNGSAAVGSFLRSDGTWAVPASGGITNVSVTTNAGVSGVVTNPTTAPAIALTLGDITPTSVNTGAITATGLKLTTGATNGYVLKTDNAGNATWQSASSSYKGMWNASTNTPTIANGTGSNGDYYVVSTSGSYGGTAFTQGGQAVYNGTTSKWESIAAVETDPMVKAITGLVKSDGTTITAAVAGTDYLKPNGSAALLTGWPTFNQATTGNAATATIATNINGGTAGQLLYQSAPNTTSMLAKASLTGDVLTWDVSGLPVWKTPVAGGITSISVASANGFSSTSGGTATAPVITLGTSISGILKGNGTSMTAAIASDFPVLNQSTTGNATTATNITGGAPGLLYQSAANTTSQILNSTATTGNVLSWNGTTPVWQAPAVAGIASITSANGVIATPSGNTVSLSLGAISPTSIITGPISSSSTITASGLITASSLQITTGANNGYVLKSDASGNATWQATTSSYKGMWNALTNDKGLANGTGTNGDYYVVSVSGTFGGVSFTQGGQAVYNGSTNKWESISAVETDPMVKAIIGMVKSDGATITAAVAGTDYLLPTGSAASLINWPTFNQNTTGNAATATTATTTANISGGLGGQLLYQSAAGVTSKLTNGTAGQVLTSAGTTLAPTWAAASGGVTAVTANGGTTGSIAGSTLTIGLGAITPTSITTGTITSSGTVTAAGFSGPLTGNATSATTAGSFSGNLAGDVSGPQGTTLIGANKVTFAKMQAITPLRLLGSGSGTAVSEITIGSNLTLTAAGVLNATAGGGGSGDMLAATYDPAGVASQLASVSTPQTLMNKTIAAGSNTITGLVNANLSGTAGITDANLATISTAGKVANSATTATASSTNNTIVLRDGSGVVTASGFVGSLTGNATTATSATNFSGALLGDITGNQTTTVIGANKVTLGKMAALTASSRLIGAGSASTTVAEITLGAGLSLTSNVLSSNGVPASVVADNGKVLTVVAGAAAWGTASGGSATANNGLTASSGNVTLGGTLNTNTIVDQGANTLTFTNTGNAGTTGQTIMNGSFKTTGAVYAKIRNIASFPTGDASWNTDDYIVIITASGAGNIVLPNPATNAGRVLIIRNNSTATGSPGAYTYITYVPLNNTSIAISRGQMLVSDGTNWYMIAGA